MERHAGVKSRTGFSQIINLRTIGSVYAVLFLLAMAMGALLTFKFSNYNNENSLIYKLFDDFNVFIFFEFEPSASVCFVIMLLNSIVAIYYSLGFFIVVILQRRILLTLLGTLAMLFQVFAEASLLNVFLVDLHEPSSNISSTSMNPHDLSPAEIHSVSVKSVWYVLFTAASFASFALHRHMMPVLSKGRLLHWWRSVATFIGCLTLFCTVMFNMVILFNGTAHWDTASVDQPGKSFVILRKIFLFVYLRGKTSTWIPLPLVMYRLLTPPTMRVRCRVELDPVGEAVKAASDDGLSVRSASIMNPSGMISGVMQMYCLLMLAAVGVNITGEATNVASLPLVLGFRQGPFNFAFTPLWVLAAACLILAVYLRIEKLLMQHRSGDDVQALASPEGSRLATVLSPVQTADLASAMQGRQVVSLQIAGVLLCVSAVSCVAISIPRMPEAGYRFLAGAFMTTMLVWSVTDKVVCSDNASVARNGVIWSVLWAVSSVTCFFSSIGSILLLLLLGTYSLVDSLFIVVKTNRALHVYFKIIHTDDTDTDTSANLNPTTPTYLPGLRSPLLVTSP